MASFTERYNRLNAAQKQAVDTLEGPVLVVAGPGTGKTELLSIRVAAILQQTDTPAQSILCLTFTEAGAQAMRNRLISIIGPEAYKVGIYTYHGFAAHVHRRFTNALNAGIELQPADTFIQVTTLNAILSGLPPENPFSSRHSQLGFVYTQPIKKAISAVKQAGLSPALLREEITRLEQVLPSVNERLDAVFSARIGSSTATALAVLISELEASGTTDGLGSRIPLPHVLAQDLAATLHASQNSSSTKPLSVWKQKFLNRTDVNTLVYRDTSNLERLWLFADLYEQYQISLNAQGYQDFDDILIHTIESLPSQPHVISELQEQYLYIHLDEFQDTNAAQLTLVRMLTDSPQNAGNPNLLAVGDDDQAIYRFQGAEVANIIQFRETYPGAQVVVLQDNYRSHQGILDLARSTITQGTQRLEYLYNDINKQLIYGGKATTTPEPSYHTFSGQPEELSWVAEQLASLAKSGVVLDDCAVITRTHGTLLSLIPYLQAANVPVRYDRQQNALEDQGVQALRTFCQAILHHQNGEVPELSVLLPAIFTDAGWNIPRAELWKVIADSKTERLPLATLLRENPTPWSQQCFSLLDSLAARALTEPAEALITTLICDEASPFVHYFLQEGQGTSVLLTRYAGLQTVLRFVNSFAEQGLCRLADWVDRLNQLESIGERLLIPISASYQSDAAVQLLTAHAAKGLEFSHVFMLSCTDQSWVRSKSGGANVTLPRTIPTYQEDEEDSLRLVYVAMTRAKQQLTLTASNHAENGSELQPLRFLINPSGGMYVAHETHDTNAAIQLAASATTWLHKHLPPVEPLERSVLEPTLQSFAVSATHLTTFLDLVYKGPSAYFQTYLLRFPELFQPQAAYGTALHAAIRWFWEEQRTSSLPSKDALIHNAHTRITDICMSPSDEQFYLAKATASLEAYYNQNADQIRTDELLEFDAGRFQPYIGTVPLHGRIDRIAPSSDGFVVTDLKTSKPLHKWATSGQDGVRSWRYQRQLQFYYTLLKQCQPFADKTIHEGCIEFLEPEQGRLISLSLAFNPDDAVRMEKLAGAIYAHTQSLNFPDVSNYSADLKGILAFEDDLIAGTI